MKRQSKKSPTLRFPEFSESWDLQQLGDVTKISSGGTPDRTNQNYWNGNIPWVTTTLIDFSVITAAEQYISNLGLKNSSAKIFPAGTVLMAMYGQGKTRGQVGILGIEATTNQACAALLPNTERFDERFLFQNLAGRYCAIRKLSNSGGQDNLSAQLIKTIDLAFPSLSEQKKIAAFLSAVDEKIGQLATKKELLLKYKKGVTQQIFDRKIRFKDDTGRVYPEWGETRLGVLCKIYDGTHMTPDYQESGVPFYSVEHVTSNDFSNTKYIAEDVYKQEKKRVVIEKGDILMTRIGDIGSSKYISWDAKASFYVSLALIKKGSKLDPEYLDQFIKSDLFQKELHRRTLHVAFPKKINLSEISECKVLVPLLEEQGKIAKFLSAIDRRIELVDEQVKKIKAFKSGLLQQMFV
jgi:type I restriction enzyme, S subunit